MTDGFPALAAVGGVRLKTACTGMKYVGRDDLLLVEFDAGTVAAGVFTRSSTAAAPVIWSREALLKQEGQVRALAVNAGNANAFTGPLGLHAVNKTATALADMLDCPQQQILVASTGVIGEPLDGDELARCLCAVSRDPVTADWRAAANAIRTTDTYAKGAGESFDLEAADAVAAEAADTTRGSCPCTIVGIAKGSGMIAPNMATMLGFVFLDLKVSHEILQWMLQRAIAKTFNCITVDGDCSTNDTVLAFATGASPARPLTDPSDPRWQRLEAALERVCRNLAHQIVRDGEGATKFVTVTVTGAETDASAHKVGMSIANSPLVKTAIAGEDANWGRVVMAVGKSGEAVDQNRLAISVGGIKIADAGAAVADFDESPVAAHMQGTEIDIAVDLGLGNGEATIWTCDLTHEYIDINADYRS